ncbi:MAG: GDP-mannose 4,6-dehydratase, partial [Alphaproteobacteria bacterium]|nr:GDP-mannose 4,6-dehydratase [Alphaproteobacteria bacterium]
FVEAAFSCVGSAVEWRGEGVKEVGVDSRTGEVIVEIDSRYFRPTEVDFLLGDASKARKSLGWVASTSFESLVQEMVEHDLDLARSATRAAAAPK